MDTGEVRLRSEAVCSGESLNRTHCTALSLSSPEWFCHFIPPIWLVMIIRIIPNMVWGRFNIKDY